MEQRAVVAKDVLQPSSEGLQSDSAHGLSAFEEVEEAIED